MQQKAADYVLLTYFVILLLFGLLALSSAGVAVGLDRFKDPYFFIKHQLLYGALPGLVLFFICAKINYTFWRQHAGLLFGLGLGLLIAVLIPGIGTSFDKGARSWFALFGASFQPAEAMKLIIIIYFSAYLAKLGNKIFDFKEGFITSLVVAMVPVFFILLQPDVGTAIILFGIIFSLLFFAQARLSHMSLLLMLGAAAFLVLILIAPYRVHRLTTFLHPELDPQGIGYQINQGFLAIGSGGWWGLGLGHSRQKFQYLPEVQADSIYAIVAEELGFVGAGGLVILLFLISNRSIIIARHAPDEFARLVVCGIMAWFVIQSLLNIGAMVGLLPLTGVPLPFVSHGGSALIVSMAAVGILINISKYSRV